MPRQIDLIVIHCADTPNGKSFRAADIDTWHREPPKNYRRQLAWVQRHQPQFTAIGYHFVIGVDGTVEEGRHRHEVGAHAQGHNQNSIGICLIGRDRFTAEQWNALDGLLDSLRLDYPSVGVIGHREVSAEGKTCPGFDVQQYLLTPVGTERAHLWPVPPAQPTPEPVPYEDQPEPIDGMSEEPADEAYKHLFRSKTFWGAIIAPLAPLASKLGVPFGPADLELYAVIAVAVAGVALAIWGRMSATQPVRVRRKKRKAN